MPRDVASLSSRPLFARDGRRFNRRSEGTHLGDFCGLATPTSLDRSFSFSSTSLSFRSSLSPLLLFPRAGAGSGAAELERPCLAELEAPPCLLTPQDPVLLLRPPALLCVLPLYCGRSRRVRYPPHGCCDRLRHPLRPERRIGLTTGEELPDVSPALKGRDRVYATCADFGKKLLLMTIGTAAGIMACENPDTLHAQGKVIPSLVRVEGRTQSSRRQRYCPSKVPSSTFMIIMSTSAAVSTQPAFLFKRSRRGCRTCQQT